MCWFRNLGAAGNYIIVGVNCSLGPIRSLSLEREEQCCHCNYLLLQPAPVTNVLIATSFESGQCLLFGELHTFHYLIVRNLTVNPLFATAFDFWSNLLLMGLRLSSLSTPLVLQILRALVKGSCLCSTSCENCSCNLQGHDEHNYRQARKLNKLCLS